MDKEVIVDFLEDHERLYNKHHYITKDTRKEYSPPFQTCDQGPGDFTKVSTTRGLCTSLLVNKGCSPIQG